MDIREFRKRSDIFLLVLLIVSLGILITRFFLAEQLTYLFLSWNLFLAIIPYGLAWLVAYCHRRSERFSIGLGSALFVWLLFFPNAPYILTDYIHLSRLTSAHQFVFDVFLISAFSLTGLFFGLSSLFIVHEVIRERWGLWYGWALAVGVSLLSGYGVYLGRFPRWNSWDILANPTALIFDAVERLAHPFAYPKLIVTTLLFAGFTFVAYSAYRWVVRRVF